MPNILIHQRFKLSRNANNWYANGFRKAHKLHHKQLGKEDGEYFGMLFIPFKYFKKKRGLIANHSLSNLSNNDLVLELFQSAAPVSATIMFPFLLITYVVGSSLESKTLGLSVLE